MAKAIPFTEQNDEIGRPKGSTENQYYGLPVARILTHIPGPTDKDPAQKTHAFISCWQLTPAELEEVKKNGGKIYVKHLGVTLSPLSVHGKNPIVAGDGRNLTDILYTPEQIREIKSRPHN